MTGLPIMAANQRPHLIVGFLMPELFEELKQVYCLPFIFTALIAQA